jgi:peptide/nickel transport system permease protein
VSISPVLGDAVAESTRGRVTIGHLRAAALRRKSFVAGVAIVAFFSLIAIFAPLLEPYSVHAQSGAVFASPSSAHPLGLDDGGVDVVSLLIAGARVSMLVAVLATAISTLIGGVVGTVAGYFGGRVDGVLMRITDYFIVIPVLPLMIVIAEVWGPSLSHVIIVIGALLWTPTARVMRAQVLSIRERAYVLRAKAMGAGHLRVIGRHVLPQVRGLLAANAVITVATAIFFESALAFLGLESTDTISWGTMVANAFQRAAVSAGAWWAVVPPGVCIALVVLACSLIGSSMEDAGNPRLLAPHIFKRRLTVERVPE